MSITPETIKHQEFPMRLKGYDPEPVRAFLAEVSRAYRATIRDQGAQWALANISDDLAGVLRAAHGAADKVMVQAEADAAEVEARAAVQARAIVADANAYATRIRTGADDEMSRALEVLHRAQANVVDVTRDAESAQQLLADAEEQAAAIRATAQRAEDDAHARAAEILAAAQARLDHLERQERQIQARIDAVQAEFQDVLHRLVGGSATTIDLTADDRPTVTIDGRMHPGDSLELFASELRTDRPQPLPGDNGSRVDPRTVHRMVAAAVDRAVEHSRA